MDVGRSARIIRLRQIARMPLVSPRLWLRRLVFWVGAVMAAVVAVGFAQAANWAGALFLPMSSGRIWPAFIARKVPAITFVACGSGVYPYGGAGSGCQTPARTFFSQPSKD